MTEEAATPGRKRSEAARSAILDATFALLTEDGFDRLSIEGVAARAGVGKTTIYRWWPSKGVLAVEAFLETVAPKIAFPESASARDDMLRQFHALAALYRGPTGRFVREMIGASQGDTQMRAAFVSGFLEPRRAAARAVFSRGVAAGEFCADLPADIAIDVLYAPLYYRLLTSGDAIDPETVDRLAHAALQGIATVC